MENEKKLGQEPAFATYAEVQIQKGMSKRFYAACAAMQGILAANKRSEFANIDNASELIIKFSYEFADELLKQENK